MLFLSLFMVLLLVLIIYIVWQKNELGKFEVSIYRINTNVDKKHEDTICRNLKGMSALKENQQKWTRFVVIADLHNHQYGHNNEKLLDKIDQIEPDFIIVAGDMMIAKPGYDLEVSLDLIGELAAKYKLYYGMGNHEYRLKLYKEQYPGMYDEFNGFLTENNVTLLENESRVIDVNGKKLNITGLEIERNYYKRFVNVKMEKDYIAHLVGEKKDDEYTVLIAHNPEYFKAYSAWGANLTLAGHVHGGMVRLPFLGGVISPKIRIFPKYDAGLCECEGKKMIVSRGLGMHTIPVRVNNRAELVVVELLK